LLLSQAPNYFIPICTLIQISVECVLELLLPLLTLNLLPPLNMATSSLCAIRNQSLLLLCPELPGLPGSRKLHCDFCGKEPA
jgi:hypothetical protein